MKRDLNKKIKEFLLKRVNDLPKSKTKTSNEDWIKNIFYIDFPKPYSGIAPIVKSFKIIYEEAQKELLLNWKKELIEELKMIEII